MLKAVFLLVIFAYTCLATCPANSVQGLSPDECYSFNKDHLSFSQAEEACATQGGHVVPVTNAFENAFLHSYLKEVDSDLTSHVWISKGSTYTNWARLDIGSGSCTSIDSKYGKWFDDDCATQLPSLCKIAAAQVSLKSDA